MFFITSVSKDDNRCIGYYSKLDKAIDAVTRNAGDMNEAGCYPYAVIENIPEGIYQYDMEPLWFKYNKNTEKYERIDFSPDFIEQPMVGFSIG